MPTHLFVAPSTQSFGELVLGLRIAEALKQRGDQVLFLAPAANEVLFRDAGIKHAHIDPLLPVFDRALLQAIRASRCDSVVLVDLLVTVFALMSRRIDPAILDRLPVPVYGLDIWDLRRGALRVDLNAGAIDLPDSVRRIVPRRLVPVPFANLDAVGAYDALPAPSSGASRTPTRDALGLGEADRLVLITTSGFQSVAATPAQRRLLTAVPAHIVDLCLRVGDRVRVLHVGPESIANTGSRYRYQPPVPGPEYRRLLEAADLMVNMNQSATSIGTALAADLPTLVATSAAPLDTPNVVPFAFRVFPFGLVAFMSTLLQNNPYLDAVPDAEISPGDSFVDAARSLLFDGRARADAVARIRAYVARVRALPTVTSVLDNLR